MICFLAALIAIADGREASTIVEFEDEIVGSYQYEILTADSTNDPKLTSAQASDYVTDDTVDDWVNDPKALIFEFTAAQNQDLIAIRFQDNGESIFAADGDMPTAADGDGNAQTLNFLVPDMTLKIDDPLDASTDVHIGHIWQVPRAAVAGDVYWGGIRYTKVGSVERYLSVKVNIVLPFIFDGTKSEELQLVGVLDPPKIDLEYFQDLAAFQFDDRTRELSRTQNPIGWVTKQIENFMNEFYSLDEESITAGDGDTVGWCIGDSNNNIHVPDGQGVRTLQPLSIDADTAGPDFANVCALEWVGHIRSLHPDFLEGPLECFSYKVPMEADNEEKCYAAFSTTMGSDTQYFALVVNVEGPENFELNEPWLAELPYSAAGFTVEESYDDTTRFWSHWYKRALRGSDSATVSYTRQSGQYAAFSFKKSGVRLELQSANEEDSSLEDLIVQSHVIPDGAGFDESGDLALEAWPHILYKVPDGALEGQRFYGKLKIIDGAIERFALVQVVIGAQPVLQDLDDALAFDFERIEALNHVLLDVSPSIDRIWSDAEDWQTVSQKVTLNLQTTIIFDIGADVDVDVSPSDNAGLKNALGLDPLVINVIEAEQYVTTRTRTAYSVIIPQDNGATPPVPTREGTKFYLSFKTTSDNKYWTVEFSYMRPYIFINYDDWEEEIELGRFRNFEHFQYDNTAMHLTSRTNAKYTYVVNRVNLKEGGVFAMSFTDVAKISVFGSDDLSESVNTAAPFSELREPTYPSRLGFAWKLPSDASLGTVYTVGLTATVGTGDDAVEYSGIWEITAVNTPMLCETPKKFLSTFPDGAFAYRFFSMGQNHDGFDSDLSYGSQEVAHKINLWVGQGFSVEIVVDGVTAYVADPRTIADQFGLLLNKGSYVLELHSEVGTKTTVDDEVTWSSLQSHATRDVYPSFAWVVPQYAEVGAKLYTRIDVNEGSNSDLSSSDFYGVFEVTVVEAPQEPMTDEPVEESETASLWSTVITTVLIVGLLSSAAAFFLI